MRSVLVIDDQKSLLDVIRLFLEKFGHMSVEVAADAREALSFLNTRQFDAIVVDYDIPDINGIEFLKIIRAKGDTTPVIIFTGVGREHAAIQAINNGADFFLQKGDDPQNQFRSLVHMINQAVDRRQVGRGLGTGQKILSDAIHFFTDAAFAIDREGKVIAWNRAMSRLSGVDAADIIGKGDYAYAVPFCGERVPMLIDLVFENESTILEHKYTVISREDEAILAWTRISGPENANTVLWMKAMPLYDGGGVFVGAIAAVRDITDMLGKDLPAQQQVSSGAHAGPSSRQERAGKGIPEVPAQKGLFDKVLGRAKSQYREGLRLYYRERRFSEAITCFDRSLAIDPSQPFAWHDRGFCLRELGRDDEALRSMEKAAELAPDDEEILFSWAETLRRTGILTDDFRIIDAAVAVFNRILRQNPDCADAWNGLAICSQHLGKEEQARQYFTRAGELRRSNRAKRKSRNLDLIV